MKISQLIFFGFVFILLLFSITTYINYKQSDAVKENTDFVDRSTTIVRQGNRFQRNLLNIVSGLRGYLLTGQTSFMQTFDSAIVENKTIIKELPTLIEDSSQARKLDTIRVLHEDWMSRFATPVLLLYQDQLSGKSVQAASDSFYRYSFSGAHNSEASLDLQRRLRQFINNEYNARENKKLILAQSIQQTKKISLYLNIVSIVTGLVIAMLLAFGISRRIMRMVKMSNLIASGNYNVHVKESGNDELGLLARSLNHMSGVLDENFTLLKRKNAELDQFAHIVSHDMKAPLRGIDNVVTWIEEDHHDELSPKVKEYLQIIKGRVVRAENLIGGILSYARVGKDVKELELVSITELLEEVMESVPLDKKIRFDFAENLPVIRSERLPLFQIFSNLISNSVKYHDKPEGNVSVYHEEHPDHYRFFVKDDGPGIAENYHQKIFQIFQTLHERDSFESTGVGLAIVKKILDERDETINITSSPGNGSVFSFTWSK